MKQELLVQAMRWSRAAFNWANRTLFAGELPEVEIRWELTPYGGCYGMTHAAVVPPVVRMHPSAWGSGSLHALELADAWHGTPACRLFALDVLVHELTHVRVGQLAAHKRAGHSSHDNEAWAGEVERISPLIGLEDVKTSTTKRARGEGGKMLRVPRKAGALPLRQLASWPHSVRPAEHYLRAGAAPLPDL